MASRLVYDQDPDFTLEKLQVGRHLLDYHRIWSDPASLIWSTQAPKITLDETRSWLQRWTTDANPDIQNYAIMLRPTSALNPSNPESTYFPPPPILQNGIQSKTAGEESPPSPRSYLIGQVGILRPVTSKGSTQQESYNRAPEMGYMIHHTHWGLGLATRAVKTFLSYYWQVLNPRDAHGDIDEVRDVVEAHIDPANAASVHIARKIGFEPGEWAGEDFRLAHSQELRKMQVWRIHRPLGETVTPATK